MENKKMLGLLSLGMIAVLGISLVAAYQGDYSVKGPDYSDDRHVAMQEADYDAWVALMSESGRHPRVLDVVTEENFAKFVEAREAGKSGDVERAVGLRAEIGLGDGIGLRDGTGFGGGKGLRQGSRMGHRRNLE